MSFEYRDDTGARLTVATASTGISIWTKPEDVVVAHSRVEEVVAGIRDAARQASGQPAAVDQVCINCEHPLADHGEDVCGQPATSPGGIPYNCGCTWGDDDTPELNDPTTADDPVQLRWGLGDVLHGDDDSTIVCMSGPDREPYWLELDPERAAALRDDLAGPAPECAPCNDTGACNGGPSAHPAAGLDATQPTTGPSTRNVIEHALTVYYQDSSAPSAIARALLAQHRSEILGEAAQTYTAEAEELDRAAQEALDPDMAADAKRVRGFAASLRSLAAEAES